MSALSGAACLAGPASCRVTVPSQTSATLHFRVFWGSTACNGCVLSSSPRCVQPQGVEMFHCTMAHLHISCRHIHFCHASCSMNVVSLNNLHDLAHFHLLPVPLYGHYALCRAMQGLVDGHTHEAWTEAAAGLLRPSPHPIPRQSGAEWQAAIRYWIGLLECFESASSQGGVRAASCTSVLAASIGCVQQAQSQSASI